MATKEQGRRTREQLVRAAMDAFADRGFRGASLDSIAAAVGVTRQGLLHYFPTKTDLLVAVLEAREEDEVRFATELAERGDSGLSDVLLAVMRRHEELPGLAQLFTVVAAESVQPEHPAHDRFTDRYERARAGFAEAVAAEQEAGRLRADVSPERLAIVLIALMDGLNVQRLLAPQVDALGAFEDLLALLRPPAS